MFSLLKDAVLWWCFDTEQGAEKENLQEFHFQELKSSLHSQKNVSQSYNKKKKKTQRQNHKTPGVFQQVWFHKNTLVKCTRAGFVLTSLVKRQHHSVCRRQSVEPRNWRKSNNTPGYSITSALMVTIMLKAHVWCSVNQNRQVSLRFCLKSAGLNPPGQLHSCLVLPFLKAVLSQSWPLSFTVPGWLMEQPHATKVMDCIRTTGHVFLTSLQTVWR